MIFTLILDSKKVSPFLRVSNSTFLAIQKVLDVHFLFTWNLFVLYFGVWTIQKKAFSIQNNGHLGSRYIYRNIP